MARWLTVAMACAAAAPGKAAAEPVPVPVHVQVDVRGDCPGDSELREALRRERLEPSADAAWRVAVAPAGQHGTVLRVDGPNGPVDRRRFDSRDCAAIAEACAVIVRGLLEGVAHPVAAPAPPPQRAPPVPPAVRPRRPPGPLEPAEPAPRAPPSPWAFGVALSGGIELGLSPASDQPFAQVELIAGRALRGGRLRLALSRDEHTASPASGGLERARTATRIELANRWQAGRWWLRPGAGAGAVISVVSAPLPSGAARAVRLLPLASASLAAGIRVGGPWSARIELGASLFPVADRYTTDAMGEIGRSSRADLSVGIGLQLDTGR